jgi:uncharacterized membrane protein YbhN (UPF0104 family)
VDDIRSFVDAAQAFFGHLAAVSWGYLALAVALHVLKLAFRVRAWQNIIRASYPDEPVPYAGVFGAYVAGVGVNSVAPARGGDLVKIYIAKRRVPDSTYPTLASTLVVETLFDFVVASVLMIWALKLGVLPGVPDLPNLPAFDWRFVVQHPAATAFIGGVLLFGAILGLSVARRRVTAFRAKLAQGFAAVTDRRAFLTQVVSWQAASWVLRVVSVWCFLLAFHIDASAETALTVLVVQGLSTILPFTPGGAGTQQAVLVFALRGTATTSAILSFSVGMQVATVVVNVLLGFGAIGIMLGTFRWREHVEAEKALSTDPTEVKESPNGEPAAEPRRQALRG